MTETTRQPELRDRVLAAAGASVAAVLLVNPLDVVKTRVQAASLVTDKPVPSCLLTRHPVRWARPTSLADCQPRWHPPASPGTPAATGRLGPLGPAAHGCSASQLQLRPALRLGHLPMSSCACALRVADLGSASVGEWCASGRGGGGGSSAYHPVTVSGVLRDIVRK
ncbi:hypothetical protein TSOC_007539, partial [Tetrabaena socialis]